MIEMCEQVWCTIVTLCDVRGKEDLASDCYHTCNAREQCLSIIVGPCDLTWDGSGDLVGGYDHICNSWEQSWSYMNDSELRDRGRAGWCMWLNVQWTWTTRGDERIERCSLSLLDGHGELTWDGRVVCLIVVITCVMFMNMDGSWSQIPT